jgi:dCTP deaminase
MYQVKDMPVHDPVRPVHERFYQMAPSGSYVVPPRTLVQGISIERFAMPSNVRGTIHPKSDYSRTGLIVFGGILYPGWHGHVVIEMQNAGDMPIKIYPGGGIATVVFEFCEEMIYAGRYQNQKSVVEVR